MKIAPRLNACSFLVLVVIAPGAAMLPLGLTAQSGPDGGNDLERARQKIEGSFELEEWKTAGKVLRPPQIEGRFSLHNGMVLFSTHRFDMVEQLCSRVVILSHGRIVAEHDVASLRTGGGPSLEEIFVRVTGQDDFTPLARQILDVVHGA